MSLLQPATHRRTSSIPSLPTLSVLSSGMNKIRRSLRSKRANVEIRINFAGDSSRDLDAPIERRPSEMMTGNIAMDVSNGSIEVEGMWVGLEGTIKSTMPQEGNNDPLYTSSHGQHVHHKFLKQVHFIDTSNGIHRITRPASPHSTKSHGRKRSNSDAHINRVEYPFLFVVPPRLLDESHMYSSAAPSGSIHALPPSMKAGRNAVEIKYTLRVKAKYRVRRTDPGVQCELGPALFATAHRSVKIIPITYDICPPISLEHYPNEYRMSDTVKLSNGRKISLSVKQNLKPINIADAGIEGVVRSDVQARLFMEGVSEGLEDTNGFSAEIKQYLHTMTFHTTKPNNRSHNLTSAKDNPNVSFLHGRETIPSDDVENLKWETCSSSIGCPQSSHLETAPPMYDQADEPQPNHKELVDGRQSILNIPLNIIMKDEFCPAFRTVFAERRYALELKVRLKPKINTATNSGSEDIKLRLRLPVQVVNMPEYGSCIYVSPKAAEATAAAREAIGAEDQPPEYMKRMTMLYI